MRKVIYTTPEEREALVLEAKENSEIIHYEEFHNGYVDLYFESVPNITEYYLQKIRLQRNALLEQCDWTQTNDSPLPGSKRREWKKYRQILRDFPEKCDTNNPAWPQPPV